MIRIPRLQACASHGTHDSKIGLVGRIESQRVLWEHTGEALDTGTGVTVCVCAAAHEGPRPKARRQEQGARPKASKAARS